MAINDEPPRSIRKRRFQDSHVHPKLRAQVYDILNGIDVESWNPATDGAIAKRYGVRSVESKDENRTALLEELQLNNKGPLIIVVSRLAHQKGIDLFVSALPEIGRASCRERV